MIYPSHIKENHVIQTHKEHLEAVAKLCCEFGKPFGLEKTCQLTGLLHDMGKGTCEFAAYIEYSYAHPDDRRRKGTVDHSTHGAKYIYEHYNACNGFEKFTAEWIAMAILSHHAGLQDFISLDGESDFLRRVLEKPLPTFEEGKDVFFQQIANEDAIEQLFRKAVQEVRALDDHIDKLMKVDKEFHFCRGMGLKVLFSILVDADRLDTARFMTGIDPRQDWDTEELWDDFADKLKNKLANFIPVNDIDHARKTISDECLAFSKQPPGIYELSVPTGSGKTLASMRYALAHAKEYHKERILVCIPYTSIIDQNAREIRTIFHNNDALLEHHSNVVETFSRDESIEMESGSYDAASEFRRSMTERWEVPVIFTTMVQLLNTLFAGGTRDIRRLHQLRNSVIIFDEIQTLPVKCTFLFNSAMNYLSRFCHDTIVLCTATQPTLQNLSIPIQKEAQSNIVKNLDQIFETFQRTKIEDACTFGGYTSEDIAGLIWQDAVKCGNVLCIVNTTATAKNIYRALKELHSTDYSAMAIIHLTTKMCPFHRKATIRFMRYLLNKKKPLICVSTQLIEAGVDISFTTVYRDIAGLASIAQAAGRCNRHGELSFGLVKIFNVQNERLDKLPDIAKGAEIATNMLKTGEASMKDLLSPQVIQRYFNNLYVAYGSKQVSYPINCGKETLYDLLAYNEAGNAARKELKNKAFTTNKPAFREAGKIFEVIDTQTVSVLIPYKRGKTLYLDFNSNIYAQKNIYKKLREAQQYMVNIFSYEVKALQDLGAIHELAIGGIWGLDEGYYDSKVGVVTETHKNEFTSV